MVPWPAPPTSVPSPWPASREYSPRYLRCASASHGPSSPAPSYATQHRLTEHLLLQGLRRTLVHNEVAKVVSFIFRLELRQLQLHRLFRGGRFDHPRRTAALSVYDLLAVLVHLRAIGRVHMERIVTQHQLRIVQTDPRQPHLQRIRLRERLRRHLQCDHDLLRFEVHIERSEVLA